MRAVSRELFIPLTVGGGIRSDDDAATVIESGADKVSVNLLRWQILRSSHGWRSDTAARRWSSRWMRKPKVRNGRCLRGADRSPPVVTPSSGRAKRSLVARVKSS